jgi:predicted metal-dependent hydrolase
MPLRAIEQFIVRKQSWIADKQRFVRERYAGVRPKVFADGEQFLYLGNTYRLYIVHDSELPLHFNHAFFLSKDSISRARELFVAWYEEQASVTIRKRVDWYAPLFGLKYNTFSVTRAQRLFGSCSARNNLHFAWRLIMAPVPAIDYVVIHELAHITEKNHSRRFWTIVERMLPDYGQGMHWLRDNGHLLVI